jgi:two-component system response regulator AlgR
MVVDDEPLARARLRALIDGLDGYECVAEAGDGAEALDRLSEAEPDIVLMDVRMPCMDGLDAAQRIATRAEPPAVIFTTAYDEHAIAAFDANADGYLLKPVRREKLAAALTNASRSNRAQQHAGRDSASNARTHLCAMVGNTTTLIPVDEVLYFRAEHKYVTLRHSGGETLLEESLKKLGEEFGERFVRIHRNALVSVARISGMEKTTDGQHLLLLRGCKEKLEISRRHLPGVRRLLKQRAAPAGG